MIENVAFGDPFADLTAHDNCTGKCFNHLCNCSQNYGAEQQSTWTNVTSSVQSTIRAGL